MDLHHDSTSAYTSMLVCEFLFKHKTVSMPQFSYSPGMVLADFFLFPKLNTPMKGKRFATIEAISKGVFQRIGENAIISVLYLRWVILKGS